MWKPPKGLPPVLDYFFQGWHQVGWVGVDMFFVLSGFLVSGLLFAEYRKKGSLSISRFYIRRGWKIYPPFLVLVVTTVLIQLLWGRGVSRLALLSELTFLQNYLGRLWSHTWSLAVEEHFYLLLPLLLAAILRIRRGTADPFKSLVPLGVAVGLALLVLRVANAAARDRFSFPTHMFPTHLRLDSLMFGVVVAYAYHFHGEWFRSTFQAHCSRLILGGALGFIPALLLPVERSPFLWTIGLTLFYLASGALLVGAVLSEVPRSGVLAAVALVGTYSYSIYLWHMPFLDWAFPYGEYFSGDKPTYLVQVFLYLIGSIALGILMSWLVETPALRLRDRWYPARAAWRGDEGPSTSQAALIEVTPTSPSPLDSAP